MTFEWDNDKASTNQTKHGVSFEEAATVFGDQLALTFVDPDHSVDEGRTLTFGVSILGTHVIVSHTDRGDALRIISARRMTPRERRVYEQG